jgi:hypothetical protein
VDKQKSRSLRRALLRSPLFDAQEQAAGYFKRRAKKGFFASLKNGLIHPPSLSFRKILFGF